MPDTPTIAEQIAWMRQDIAWKAAHGWPDDELAMQRAALATLERHALAEAGCSAHEIAAITGHKTLAEVQRYTAAADQVRLADAAIRRTE